MGRATIKTTTLVFEMRVKQPPSMTATQLEQAVSHATLVAISSEFPQQQQLLADSKDSELVELRLIKKETEYK